jgi:hypothetical protein
MSKSTVLSVALAVTAAGSLWLWTQWRNERAANLDLRARVESLERHHERAPVAAPAAASAPAHSAQVPTAHLESSPGARLYNPVPNYPGMVQTRLMKNPEFRKALRNQQRLMVENELRDLPRVLNLSPEQAARLFDLMADQGVKLLQLQWEGPANWQEGKSSKAAVSDLRKQNDAELTEILGERNMSELKEYRASMGSRAEVGALRGELARAPEPMREDQVEPMIAVVYAEQRRVDQELRDRFGSQSSGSQDPEYSAAQVELAIAANKRIVESAQPLLSGAQLSAVKDFYERQRRQMEANIALGRLQAEALAGDAPSMKPN